LAWLWLGIAAAGAASILFVIAFRRVEGTPRNLVALALLSAMLLPFLLPKMHERFFFLADALALAFLALRRDPLGWAVFLLVEIASAAALVGVLYRLPLPPVLGGVMMLAAILILARSLRYGSQVEHEYEPLPLGRLDLA
jgi:hypothetical protein